MRRILLAIILTTSALCGWAQVTTSSLTGTIRDNSGEGIPGASVLAVHEPSGTTFGTATLADGRYTIYNMRVGGPYKITISFIGYETQSYSDIYIKLGEPYNLSHVLKEEGTQLEEILVGGACDHLEGGQMQQYLP